MTPQKRASTCAMNATVTKKSAHAALWGTEGLSAVMTPISYER